MTVFQVKVKPDEASRRVGESASQIIPRSNNDKFNQRHTKTRTKAISLQLVWKIMAVALWKTISFTIAYGKTDMNVVFDPGGANAKDTCQERFGEVLRRSKQKERSRAKSLPIKI